MPFGRGLIVGTVLKYRYPGIQFTGPDRDFRRMIFRPNSNLTAGLRLNAYGINLEMSGSTGQSFLDPDRYGTSKARDITLNVTRTRWIGDLQFLRYQGLWFRRSWGGSPSLTIPSRNDLEIRKRSSSFIWILRPDRLSYRGAYLFTERQNRSGGSPLVRINLNTWNFTGRDPLMDPEDQVHFSALGAPDGIYFTALGIAPGYSHTFTWKRFFMNGTLLAGGAHYWVRYARADQPDQYDIQFNFTTSIGLAAGYNGDRYFFGVNYRGQGFRVTRQDTRLTGSQNSFVVMAGVRLHDHWGLKKKVSGLKKPVEDILKR